MVCLLLIPRDILIMILDEFITMRQIILLDTAIVNYKLREIVVEIYPILPEKILINPQWQCNRWLMDRKIKLNVNYYSSFISNLDNSKFDLSLVNDIKLIFHPYYYSKYIDNINQCENLKKLIFFESAIYLNNINHYILSNLLVLEICTALNNTNMKTIYKYCNNLIALKLEFKNDQVNIVNEIIIKNKKLSEINFTGQVSRLKLDILTKCENITINNDPNLNILYFLKNNIHLECLCYKNIKYEKNHALFICQNLAKYTYLYSSYFRQFHIENLSNLTNDILMKLLLNSKEHLISLKIINCSLITQQGIDNVLKYCTNLEKTDIRENGKYAFLNIFYF